MVFARASRKALFDAENAAAMLATSPLVFDFDGRVA
jgi:hypothetical protein